MTIRRNMREYIYGILIMTNNQWSIEEHIFKILTMINNQWNMEEYIYEISTIKNNQWYMRPCCISPIFLLNYSMKSL
jgi:hypothetical protein